MGPGAALNDDDTDDALLTPLGEFMRRRNAELGLSVAAVAQRVGMSRATWYRIARGESASPGLHLLRGLARVYRVRAAELFALAASADALLSTPQARTSSSAGDAGGVLWRCRYERRVRPGTMVEVQLELLNLSDRPWVGAEVHCIHEGWLPLRFDAAAPRQSLHASRGVPLLKAVLAPTPPGDWVQTRIALQAPSTKGHFVACLALYAEHPLLPTGTGAFLLIETR